MTASRYGSTRETMISYMTIDDILLLEHRIKELEFIKQLGDSTLAPIIL